MVNLESLLRVQFWFSGKASVVYFSATKYPIMGGVFLPTRVENSCYALSSTAILPLSHRITQNPFRVGVSRRLTM
jgi:hypothetical protein